MSDTKQSVFAKYTASTAKPSASLELIDGGKPEGASRDYRAYGIDKPGNRTARIRVECHDADRVVLSLAKSYLVEVQYSEGCFIALIFTTCAVMLEGRNLDTLMEHLDDDQLKSIHAFNSTLHDRPPEGEAIITRIRRISLQEFATGVEETDS